MEFLVILVSLAILCLVGAIGYDVGKVEGRQEMEDEAIKRGYAERVIANPSDRETTFQWKEKG